MPAKAQSLDNQSGFTGGQTNTGSSTEVCPLLKPPSYDDPGIQSDSSVDDNGSTQEVEPDTLPPADDPAVTYSQPATLWKTLASAFSIPHAEAQFASYGTLQIKVQEEHRNYQHSPFLHKVHVILTGPYQHDPRDVSGNRLSAIKGVTRTRSRDSDNQGIVQFGGLPYGIYRVVKTEIVDPQVRAQYLGGVDFRSGVFLPEVTIAQPFTPFPLFGLHAFVPKDELPSGNLRVVVNAQDVEKPNGIERVHDKVHVQIRGPYMVQTKSAEPRYETKPLEPGNVGLDLWPYTIDAVGQDGIVTFPNLPAGEWQVILWESSNKTKYPYQHKWVGSGQAVAEHIQSHQPKVAVSAGQSFTEISMQGIDALTSTQYLPNYKNSATWGTNRSLSAATQDAYLRSLIDPNYDNYKFQFSDSENHSLRDDLQAKLTQIKQEWTWRGHLEVYTRKLDEKIDKTGQYAAQLLPAVGAQVTIEGPFTLDQTYKTRWTSPLTPQIHTAIAGSDGIARFANLDPGKYKVIHYGAPSLYPLEGRDYDSMKVNTNDRGNDNPQQEDSQLWAYVTPRAIAKIGLAGNDLLYVKPAPLGGFDSRGCHDYDYITQDRQFVEQVLADKPADLRGRFISKLANDGYFDMYEIPAKEDYLQKQPAACQSDKQLIAVASYFTLVLQAERGQNPRFTTWQWDSVKAVRKVIREKLWAYLLQDPVIYAIKNPDFIPFVEQFRVASAIFAAHQSNWTHKDQLRTSPLGIDATQWFYNYWISDDYASPDNQQAKDWKFMDSGAPNPDIILGKHYNFFGERPWASPSGLAAGVPQVGDGKDVSYFFTKFQKNIINKGKIDDEDVGNALFDLVSPLPRQLPRNLNETGELAASWTVAALIGGISLLGEKAPAGALAKSTGGRRLKLSTQALGDAQHLFGDMKTLLHDVQITDNQIADLQGRINQAQNTKGLASPRQIEKWKTQLAKLQEQKTKGLTQRRQTLTAKAVSQVNQAVDTANQQRQVCPRNEPRPQSRLARFNPLSQSFRLRQIFMKVAGDGARLGLNLQEKYNGSLPYHNQTHVYRAMNRVVKQLAPQLQRLGLMTTREMALAELAMAWHDRIQGKGPGVNEAESIRELHNWMTSMNQKYQSQGVLFTPQDFATVEEAINVTVPAFNNGVVSQPNLTPQTGIVARVVALSDLGTAGMDGWKYFGEEGPALAREIFKDADKQMQQPQNLLGPKNRDVRINIAKQWYGMLKGQSTFVQGRQALLPNELAGLPQSAQQVLSTKVFRADNFADCIKQATAQAHRAEQLTNLIEHGTATESDTAFLEFALLMGYDIKRTGPYVVLPTRSGKRVAPVIAGGVETASRASSSRLLTVIKGDNHKVIPYDQRKTSATAIRGTFEDLESRLNQYRSSRLGGYQAARAFSQINGLLFDLLNQGDDLRQIGNKTMAENITARIQGVRVLLRDMGQGGTINGVVAERGLGIMLTDYLQYDTWRSSTDQDVNFGIDYLVLTNDQPNKTQLMAIQSKSGNFGRMPQILWPVRNNAEESALITAYQKYYQGPDLSARLLSLERSITNMRRFADINPQVEVVPTVALIPSPNGPNSFLDPTYGEPLNISPFTGVSRPLNAVQRLKLDILTILNGQK